MEPEERETEERPSKRARAEEEIPQAVIPEEQTMEDERTGSQLEQALMLESRGLCDGGDAPAAKDPREGYNLISVDIAEVFSPRG